MVSTRSQICDAARGIFLDEGPEGISMRRVAADVGITPPAIYRHFEDKQALVTAIVDEGFAILETNMRRATSGAQGIDAMLCLLDCYIDFSISQPRYFDSMFLLPRPDVRRYPEDFQRGTSSTFSIALEFVSAAMEAGEMRADEPLETTLTLWSHAHGLAALYRCGRFGDHPVRFRKAYHRSMRRIFDGLRA